MCVQEYHRLWPPGIGIVYIHKYEKSQSTFSYKNLFSHSSNGALILEATAENKSEEALKLHIQKVLDSITMV